MAVKIRMMRMGRRHRPFFRINAIESHNPRDGKILEKLGHYDPIEKDKEKQVVLNTERIKYWLDKGAIPSDTVSELLLRHNISTKYAEKKTARRVKAKAIATAKGKHFTKADKVAAEKAAETAEEKAKAEAKAAEEKVKAKEKAKAEAETAEAIIEKTAEPVKEEVAEAAEEKTEAEASEKEKAKPEAEAIEVAEEAEAEDKAAGSEAASSQETEANDEN